ncbi:uncharacterized protein IAS62_005910 [Cryptococcus decagattii]|uniref:Uncharacterized protein n=1 Tax=Cryptococcus decagattii TaxID=1859122 RepID=A0ABZ2B4K4_9TREE
MQGYNNIRTLKHQRIFSIVAALISHYYLQFKAPSIKNVHDVDWSSAGPPSLHMTDILLYLQQHIDHAVRWAQEWCKSSNSG